MVQVSYSMKTTRLGDLLKILLQLWYYFPPKISSPTYLLDSCPWATPTENKHQLKCKDGTLCNVKSDGWACCALHGGREKCPKKMPIMCAAKTCVNNTDHCCSDVRGWNGEPACAGKFGGPLTCNREGIIPPLFALSSYFLI